MIRFSGDMVIMTTNEENFQYAINIINEITRACKMKINNKKKKKY